MTVAPGRTIALGDQFARDLPELALDWRAEPSPDPHLLVLNELLALELGLDPEWLRSPDGLHQLLGTDLPDDAHPVAQAYAGHQFGGFNPRLGDGRALLLGDLVDAQGRRRDLHLKGSGPTPFSRGGDGYAAVGPMLREHVISEAMHALGIPTTRSLAVVGTGRPVRRDTVLPGAVLVRVASSHLRVGTFQYARQSGDLDLLQRLVDHAIARHHPDVTGALGLLDAVVAAQASLIAQWMLVGFVHGVMNTDNMTISGETIDYGPCAFMEAFDPRTVYSSIDVGGRYAYGNQPAIGQWNLTRLAESLLPLIHEDQDTAIAIATEALQGFRPRYDEVWSAGMMAKLGLPRDAAAGSLVEDLLVLLEEGQVDHTSFYRDLVRGLVTEAPFAQWAARWKALGPDTAAMDRANPVYIPRNRLVEESLAAATAADLAALQRLLEVISAPYDERPGFERYSRAGDVSGYQTFCGT